MEIMISMIFMLGFCVLPIAVLVAIALVFVHNKNPDFLPRVRRFLLFLFLPHRYLHQMYSYAATNKQGYLFSVEYVINDKMYKAYGFNYYEAMWIAAKG